MEQLFVRALVVGAHVDDPELFAGGTIARFSKTMQVLCFSRHAGICPSPEHEFKQSALVLGVKGRYEALDMPACQSGPTSFAGMGDLIRNKLERYRSEFNPTVVITHQSTDTNQDHQQVHLEVKRVFRKTPILCGRFWPNDLPAADRRFLVKLCGEDMQCKLQSLRSFPSQQLPHRSYFDEEVIMAEARFYGAMIGVGYAEAFEAIRIWI